MTIGDRIQPRNFRQLWDAALNAEGTKNGVRLFSSTRFEAGWGGDSEAIWGNLERGGGINFHRPEPDEEDYGVSATPEQIINELREASNGMVDLYSHSSASRSCSVVLHE